MTPEERAKALNGEWVERGSRIWRVIDETTVIAAIREAEAAVHAKYAELVKAADKVIAHVRLLDRPDEESHLKRLHERAAEYRAARAALKGETK